MDPIPERARGALSGICQHCYFGVGSTPFIGEVNSVLSVVYTDRAVTFATDDEDDLDPDLIYHRIISTRLATRKEKKLYEEHKAILYSF